MKINDNISLRLNEYSPSLNQNKPEGFNNMPRELRAFIKGTMVLGGGLLINPSNNSGIGEYQIINSGFEISQVLEKSKEAFEGLSYYSTALEKKYTDYKANFIKNIMSFVSLESRWDGFGALPLEVDCATNAVRLLDSFEPSILSKITELYPNPNSTLTIEWENEDEEIVSLECGKETFTYFVDFNSMDTKFYNKQKISLENIKTLKEHIVSI